jgi:hypothetical protein
MNSLKWKIIGGAIAAIAITLLVIYWILPERFITRVDKTMLEYFGGNCVVDVYSGGVKVRDYKVDGYVMFERQDSDVVGTNPARGRHDGVVTFKDKEGRMVRIGAMGATILVECK